MQKYTFNIKEVNRDGYIAWDAIDEQSGDQFSVNIEGYLVAGDFPEITEYLKINKGIDFDVSYSEDHGDSLCELKWTYQRNEIQVFVIDIPRAVLKVTWENI